MKLSEMFKNPLTAAIVAGVAGFLIGMLVFWVIIPVQAVDAPVSLLRADLQEDYLRMAIDSFAVNADPNLAVQRWQNLGPAAPGLFLKIEQSVNSKNAPLIKFYGDLIRATVGITASTTAETEPKAGLSMAGMIVIALAGALLLGVLGFLIYYFFRSGRGKGEVTPAMQAAEISRSAERTDFTSMGVAQPVTQTMTTYVLGDDLYDESFSIDSPTGDFLGEYGVGISETIGVGDPKKVAAVEIWLFDKNDIKTATKVLMTPHAFDDRAMRGRLEAKGELVLIQQGAEIMLETATLQLVARVMDVQFGVGPQPPNSYFERVTLELAVWPKQ